MLDGAALAAFLIHTSGSCTDTDDHDRPDADDRDTELRSEDLVSVLYALINLRCSGWSLLSLLERIKSRMCNKSKRCREAGQDVATDLCI